MCSESVCQEDYYCCRKMCVISDIRCLIVIISNNYVFVIDICVRIEPLYVLAGAHKKTNGYPFVFLWAPGTSDSSYKYCRMGLCKNTTSMAIL